MLENWCYALFAATPEPSCPPVQLFPIHLNPTEPHEVTLQADNEVPIDNVNSTHQNTHVRALARKHKQAAEEHLLKLYRFFLRVTTFYHFS